ncbi:hypothetical protein C3463_01990 [Serratia marcescens]|nr:hypothetical protein C3464_05175 [Serratia marcescens]POX29803.1 hypothetical protein C3463_01990 [Serratia marcescens]
MTKAEKAWFFLLCGEQPKINELISLILNAVFGKPGNVIRLVINLRWGASPAFVLSGSQPLGASPTSSMAERSAAKRC